MKRYFARLRVWHALVLIAFTGLGIAYVVLYAKHAESERYWRSKVIDLEVTNEHLLTHVQLYAHDAENNLAYVTQFFEDRPDEHDEKHADYRSFKTYMIDFHTRIWKRAYERWREIYLSVRSDDPDPPPPFPPPRGWRRWQSKENGGSRTPPKSGHKDIFSAT